jgi:hypothetical protein
MRAVKKLNQNMCSGLSVHETLKHSSDALNFLSMAGIFDESKADALAMLAAISLGTTLNNETLLKAIDEIIDSSIEFILENPDLEYVENTMDLSSLQKTCPINFSERVHLTATVQTSQDLRVLSPKTTKLVEIATPRISNKTSCDLIEMM